jgi:hypothetical protein
VIVTAAHVAAAALPKQTESTVYQRKSTAGGGFVATQEAEVHAGPPRFPSWQRLLWMQIHQSTAVRVYGGGGYTVSNFVFLFFQFWTILIW